MLEDRGGAVADCSASTAIMGGPDKPGHDEPYYFNGLREPSPWAGATFS